MRMPGMGLRMRVPRKGVPRRGLRMKVPRKGMRMRMPRKGLRTRMPRMDLKKMPGMGLKEKSFELSGERNFVRTCKRRWSVSFYSEYTGCKIS